MVLKSNVTRSEYCQYLLVSQIDYTLTNFADHTEKFLGASDFCVGKMKSYRNAVAALLGARVFRPARFPERVLVVSELQKCGELEICS